MKLVKNARVYISDEAKRIIIASLHDKGGITYEQEKCFVADYPVDATILGTEVINKLNLFSFKDIDLRNLKRTDWPAFKYSKAKSVRKFEESYIGIDIRSLTHTTYFLK